MKQRMMMGAVLVCAVALFSACGEKAAKQSKDNHSAAEAVALDAMRAAEAARADSLRLDSLRLDSLRREQTAEFVAKLPQINKIGTANLQYLTALGFEGSVRSMTINGDPAQGGDYKLTMGENSCTVSFWEAEYEAGYGYETKVTIDCTDPQVVEDYYKAAKKCEVNDIEGYANVKREGNSVILEGGYD